jgi:uncharacterized protein YodC (DUF2158 family)
MSKFKIGAIVHLNSGGPAMTVSHRIVGKDMVQVYWFSGGQVLKESFHQECLKDEQDTGLIQNIQVVA